MIDVAPRVRLLVSVRDAVEARLAAEAGADLVDVKDPDRGALGALPVEVVRKIVAAAREANPAVVTSAVAGEPDGADALAAALHGMAASSADFLKVAVSHKVLMDRGAVRAALAVVSTLSAPPGESRGRAPWMPTHAGRGGGVIAVLFAEDRPDPGLVPRLAELGFAGAMIDTRLKRGTRLPELLPPATLAAFVAACRAHGLVSGLAGSLALSDIPTLARHKPDYLGFRGGLCAEANRRGALDAGRIAEAARRLQDAPTRDAA